MTDKLTFFAGLIAACLGVVLIALFSITISQQAQAKEEKAYDALICRINEIEDNDNNMAQIRLTNAQIKEEKRLEAERIERERLEAEEKARQEEEARLAEEQAKQEQARLAEVSIQSQANGVLTKSGGVNYFNGSKETWYSSNQLYHRNTGNWTLGSDGVYRDSDGYIVVARSDMSQGSTIETSLGQGKVYDSGCAAGVTDIYTKW